MKKLKILLLSTLTVISFLACEDDDNITVEPEAGAALLEADISRIELDRDNTDNPALTLSWSDATFSQQTPVSYRIEASDDEAFTNPSESITVTTNSITFSVSDLNALAGNAGLPPFEWNLLYLRVKSFLGETPGSVQSASNAINIDVYTYYNYFVEDFFLVGPASASDWNNNNNNAILFRDPDNIQEFSYTGRFNGGPFKVLAQRGAWAPQYGEPEDGPGFLILRPDENADAPPAINDLEGQDPGYYEFSVNFSNLSFSVTPFDLGSASPLSSLTISGSALASEATLTQYDIGGEVFDEFIWYIPSVRMVPGEFTFTANGTDSWGSTTLFSGTATPDGGNIPVDVEDDYEVWFNSLTGQYHFIPINISQL